MPSSIYMSITELTRWIKSHPLDCSKSSFVLIKDLEAAIGLRMSLRSLVMAALVAGYAVTPRSESTFFYFTKAI